MIHVPAPGTAGPRSGPDYVPGLEPIVIAPISTNESREQVAKLLGVAKPCVQRPDFRGRPARCASVRTYHAGPFAALERGKLNGRCMMNKITHLLLAGAVGLRALRRGHCAGDSAAIARRRLCRRGYDRGRRPSQESLPIALARQSRGRRRRRGPRGAATAARHTAVPVRTGAAPLGGRHPDRRSVFRPRPAPRPVVLSVAGLVCRGGGSDRQAAPHTPISAAQSRASISLSTKITVRSAPEGDQLEYSLRRTGLDRVSPRFRGLPPAFWVRRIHDRLPASGNHGQRERA